MVKTFKSLLSSFKKSTLLSILTLLCDSEPELFLLSNCNLLEKYPFYVELDYINSSTVHSSVAWWVLVWVVLSIPWFLLNVNIEGQKYICWWKENCFWRRINCTKYHFLTFFLMFLYCYIRFATLLISWTPMYSYECIWGIILGWK
jgi:hypothetical protein